MVEQVVNWRRLLLTKIGADDSDTNLTALGAWAASEGMPVWMNNPLAATDTYLGSRPYPPAPLVQVYADIQDAVAVYANKFYTPPYAAIGAAFVTGEDYDGLWTAINESPWCSGCQGGKYPIGLWQVAFGKTRPQPPPKDEAPVHAWPIPAELAPKGVKELHHSWDQFTRAVGHVLPGSVRKANRYVDRLMDAVE